MKEGKSTKTDNAATIERPEQKKATQQQSSDKVSEQIFANVVNKDTFGPPKMSYMTGKGIRGIDRLAPRNIKGTSK